MMWKVGDGRSIKIWEDKWLPCTPGRNPDRPIVTFVRDLVDEDRKWWNEELIDKIFDSQTARVIKQISLGSINNPDCVRWKETQSGEYSI